MAESEEELKSLLMKVKEESGKRWLEAQHSENEDHGICLPSLHGKQMGKQWKQCQTLFWGAPKSLQMVIAAMELKFLLGSKVMTNLDSILKSRNITLLIKVLLVKAVVLGVIR